MKHQYYTTPENMKGLEAWGFSWLEFVTSISAPMFLVTSYKSNGKANSCMQITMISQWQQSKIINLS